MSDEHVDAAVELISADAVTFASLPLALACRVFLALPVDARGRACCVCRAWRDALAEPSLWTRLDMSVVDVAQDPPWFHGDEWQRYVSVLNGARGQLRELDLSQQFVVRDKLLPVLTAYAGSLRTLHLEHVEASYYDDDVPIFEGVVAAAPLLQVLVAEYVYCTWKDAHRVLRAEPPLAPLQVRGRLEVHFDDDEDAVNGDMERFGPFAAALADATLQPALLRLRVFHADTAQPAVIGALVDAALARRLRGLTLYHCTLPPAAPLARLLAEGSLTVFHFYGTGTPSFDAAGAALVADALRVNKKLTKLKLYCSGLCHDMSAAGLLVGALVGHPNLRELCITGEHNTVEDGRAFGAALAELIAADVPALQIVGCGVHGNVFGDACMAPIADALPLNHYLRALHFDCSRMSEAFASERLLPPAGSARKHDALRADVSLLRMGAPSCCGGGGAGAPPGAAELKMTAHPNGVRGERGCATAR